LSEKRPPYEGVVQLTEMYLDRWGPGGPSGVGWVRDAGTRYRVMMGLILPSEAPATLLDFGCGLSNLNDFIIRNKITGILYSGLELSSRFLAHCREKYPDITYYQIDVLDPASPEIPAFDYVIMNGMFTYLGNIHWEEKFSYFQALVRRVFDFARIGIAFNVMSKQVEWERDDLFHLPVDTLLTFLSNELSRHVVIRHDYGLYEYTAYVYKQPTDPEMVGAKRTLRG
jgi:hypothetical protein